MEKVKTRAFILKSPSDYQAWRIETYYHLLGQGWYSHIDDSDPRPHDAAKVAQQQWDRDDAKALALMNGLMSPAFKLQFKAATTLKLLWERLERQFQARGFSQRYTALLNLVQTTLSSCDDDIDQYCSKFTQARDEQIIANGDNYSGNNMTEDNLVTLFVGGLTSSTTFEPFVLNFRQKEKMPNLEETMSLAREEVRISPIIGSQDNPIVLNTQKIRNLKNRKRKRGNCPKHPGLSHNKDDCWVLHPEKRPKYNKPLINRTEPKDSWKHGALAALTVNAMVTLPTTRWAIDSGASQHFCNDLSMFSDLKDCQAIHIRGSTGSYSSKQRGSVHLLWTNRHRDTQPIHLRDVLYVPTLPVNLISASLLKKRGIYFNTFDNTL
jgi:hypothetical protein